MFNVCRAIKRVNIFGQQQSTQRTVEVYFSMKDIRRRLNVFNNNSANVMTRRKAEGKLIIFSVSLNGNMIFQKYILRWFINEGAFYCRNHHQLSSSAAQKQNVYGVNRRAIFRRDHLSISLTRCLLLHAQCL